MLTKLTYLAIILTLTAALKLFLKRTQAKNIREFKPKAKSMCFLSYDLYSILIYDWRRLYLRRRGRSY